MNLFEHASYPRILKLWVTEKKKSDKTFTFSKVAEEIGVQKAFISQVISEKTALNADQAFKITKVLGFGPEETEYFLLLVERERSGVSARKEEINRKIKEFQKKHGIRKSVKPQYAAEGPQADHLKEYHLDPFHSVVHVFLTIPEFQKKPQLLEQKLGLAKERLQRILWVLTELGVIEQDAKKGGVKILKERVHSPDRNHLSAAQQLLFRSLSLEKIMRVSSDKRYGFNVTYSADQKTFEEVQKEFHRFVEKIGDIVAKAPPVAVYQLNFDIFPWSE